MTEWLRKKKCRITFHSVILYIYYIYIIYILYYILYIYIIYILQYLRKFTFSLYSCLRMEQFKMEGGSSLGMGITVVTVSFPGAIDSIFCLRISCVPTLLRPWAKKLFFSYSINVGLTERVEWLLTSTVTWRASPVKWGKGSSSICSPNQYLIVVTILHSDNVYAHATCQPNWNMCYAVTEDILNIKE